MHYILVARKVTVSKQYYLTLPWKLECWLTNSYNYWMTLRLYPILPLQTPRWLPVSTKTADYFSLYHLIANAKNSRWLRKSVLSILVKSMYEAENQYLFLFYLIRACVLIQESSDKKKVISVERRSWRTTSLLNGLTCASWFIRINCL